MAKTTRAEAEQMVIKYITEIGLTQEQTYNAERKAWYWYRGSAGIEVFVQDVPVGDFTRSYLRVFSPILKIQAGKELAAYRKLLELNDTKLGLKLTLLPNSNQVYATYERDINGMDYEELATTIADLEWWADKLDDELKAEFGETVVSDRR